jgi:hypothetical protein
VESRRLGNLNRLWEVLPLSLCAAVVGETLNHAKPGWKRRSRALGESVCSHCSRKNQGFMVLRNTMPVAIHYDYQAQSHRKLWHVRRTTLY